MNILGPIVRSLSSLLSAIVWARRDPPPLHAGRSMNGEVDVDMEHDDGPQWGGFVNVFRVLIPRRQANYKDADKGANPDAERPRAQSLPLSRAGE